MNVVKFPQKSSDNIVKAYTARLDTQNAKVEEVMILAERWNAELYLEMQKYLKILQDFARDCPEKDFIEFLKARSANHNLQVIDDNIVFQLQLDFGDEK